jgi:hypothetical protein
MNYRLMLTIQAHPRLTRAELEARVSAVVGKLESAGTISIGPWSLETDPDGGGADGQQEGADRRAAAELGEIVRHWRAGE